MCPLVKFHPKGREIDVPAGTNLMEAALRAGIELDSACGGKGVCGKCKMVVEGPHSTLGAEHIAPEEWKVGYRLACRSLVQGDLTIFVPDESQLSAMVIEEGSAENGLSGLEPLVKADYVQLAKPTLTDTEGDLERLARAIGVHSPRIDLRLMSKLPALLRENASAVTVFHHDNAIQDIRAWDQVHRNFGLALDIGTTTVVLQLIDLSDGRVMTQSSDYNKQLMCGEDVLSRIMFAEENGTARLQQLIVDTINHLIDRLTSRSDHCEGKRVCAEEITSIAIAGNTTMIHLLLGIPPTHIRYEPYVSVSNRPPLMEARELGLRINPLAMVYIVPGRSSYVGGDIVADVVASKMAESSGTSLLIDVGTNGEIVLGNSEWLLACSTSAGPAFEGGEVRFGMRASNGAIERVVIDDDVRLEIIGGGRPRGICGSGLIDLTAQLLLSGKVDKKGRLKDGARVRQGENGKEFVLHVDDRTEGAKNDLSCCPGAVDRSRADIVIDEADLVNVIRTKAAIFAGAEVLMDSADMEFDQLDRIYIAGGFGKHIDLDNAIAIGLLPDVPRESFDFIGNAALNGARMALLSAEVREAIAKVQANMTYLELSTDARFFDRFSSASFLPHTEIRRFPSVAERLQR